MHSYVWFVVTARNVDEADHLVDYALEHSLYGFSEHCPCEHTLGDWGTWGGRFHEAVFHSLESWSSGGRVMTLSKEPTTTSIADADGNKRDARYVAAHEGVYPPAAMVFMEEDSGERGAVRVTEFPEDGILAFSEVEELRDYLLDRSKSARELVAGFVKQAQEMGWVCFVYGADIHS